MEPTSFSRLAPWTTIVNLTNHRVVVQFGRFTNRRDGKRLSRTRPSYLTCGVNTVQKVDVAQRVDELAFLYTNIRPRHQRNRTTVWPHKFLNIC